MAFERKVLIAMCALIAVNQFGFGATIPSLPLYAQSFGVSLSAIGVTIAIYGLARMLAAVPSAQISDTWGRRHCLALGGALLVAGNAWSAMATGLADFTLSRFVAGAGGGLVLTTGQIILADISTVKERGRFIGIYQGTFLLAVGIGPYPGGVLAEHVGLAAPFWAAATASVLTTAIAWFVVGETRDRTHNPAKVGGSQRMSLSRQIEMFSANRGFTLVGLVGFMHSFVRTGGLFAVIPLLAVSRIGLSVSSIGLAMMIGSICGLSVAYLGGWLTDRYGRKAVIVPSTVLTGTSMLLFCWAGAWTMFLTAAIVWSVSSSIGSSAPAAYAADSAPPGANASAVGMFRMLSDAGYVVGPIAMGLLADTMGATASIEVSAMMLVVAGGLFAAFAPETYRGKSGG
jgi:predicted MFS family arabinose efflux permease